MKKLSIFFKTILLFSLFFFLNRSTFSQILVAGDIAFSGYIFQQAGAEPDEFSFVLLKDLNAGTTINFTDNGWTNPSTLRVTETTIVWTVPTGGLLAGKEIKIVSLTATLAGGGAAGTVTGTALSLNGNNGDQILAYQTPTTIIAAIHTNIYVSPGDPVTTNATVWDGTGNITNASSSALPAGLSNGTNAIWIAPDGAVTSTERRNAKFVAPIGLDLSTVSSVRTALNNIANWTVSQLQGTQTAASFTLPTNERYLQGPLPVKLSSFTAKINSENQAQLNWKVVEQSEIQQYTIEKSLDAKIFEQIGKIEANKATLTEYQFLDANLTFGQNYYRIKIFEQNGNFSFSKIISLNKSVDLSDKFFPNPVSDYLNIKSINIPINSLGELFDANGKSVFKFKIIDNQPINLKNIADGLYLLKLADGKTYKILKN